MSSVNKVILLGNLGADPEIRRNKHGDPIVNLRLATSENWRDKSTGEKREKTEWHTVVIFNENLATTAERYLTKGSKIYIEGKLVTRKWVDKDANDRWTTEVVLDRFGSVMQLLGGTKQGGGGQVDDGQGPQGGRLEPDSGACLDDDIPFISWSD